MLAAALACAAGGPHDARANTWPPARGADMTDPANWPDDPGYQSDWNYWSWLPKQKGAPKPYVDGDVTLGASGIHADVAWTYTTGRPDVKIAVIDCGIKWDDGDLADKAYLSAAELAKHKPQNADGSACGGAGALGGYDCDGNGVFSVADYLGDPRIAPVVTDPTDVCYPGANPNSKGQPRMTGDLNKNCILDAGDLIALFSDGVDDDANGYTDDISGWDFYKNDNDPYDDTRYGHGTGESRDSSAAGNNAQGDIGICPDCRFLMLRAGDSFIADANDFAKGVVYAADNGVKVVQEALGTIDQTTFSKAAIDYAYAHGTLVVASMADENSRHHNMPAAANHTLPVHAIQKDGDLSGTGAGITTTSTTFIAFNLCSNYGGQNMLSVSGDSCSSEATGKGSGAAGLLFSEGLNRQLQLTPEEVMQLFKMNADVIDVPESRSPNPNVSGAFFESLPYFSQRFGYGRPNLDRSMQAIDAGLIPPEVDLTSPAWFDVLYADRLTGPVAIEGRVSAKRAQSLRLPRRVGGRAWSRRTRTSSPSSTGCATSRRRRRPGARAAPRSACSRPSQIDTVAHARSGLGEVPRERPDHHPARPRRRALRERRRAGAGAPVHRRRQPAERPRRRARRGVPRRAGHVHGEQPEARGRRRGRRPRRGRAGLGRHAPRALAQERAARRAPRVPVPHRSPRRPEPPPGRRAGRLDDPELPERPRLREGRQRGHRPDDGPRDHRGDARDGRSRRGRQAGDRRVDLAGHRPRRAAPTASELPGWPRRLPLVPSCPDDPRARRPRRRPAWTRVTSGRAAPAASPVLADFDRDGKPEIVQAAFDGNVYVWHADGSALAGWPVLLHSKRANQYNRIVSTPAVGDFNGDGIPDVVSGSNEEVGRGRRRGQRVPRRRPRQRTPRAAPVLPQLAGRPDVELHIFPARRRGHRPRAGDRRLRPERAAAGRSSQGNGAPAVRPAGRSGRAERLRRSAQPPARLPGRTAGDAGRASIRRRSSATGSQAYAARHDVPALQPPLGRRPRPGRRAGHHHVGRQPQPRSATSRAAARGVSRPQYLLGDVERRDGAHVLRARPCPSRTTRSSSTRPSPTSPGDGYPEVAARDGRLLRARGRRVRLRGAELAQVHRRLAHRHARGGRHRRRPQARGRDAGRATGICSPGTRRGRTRASCSGSRSTTTTPTPATTWSSSTRACSRATPSPSTAASTAWRRRRRATPQYTAGGCGCRAVSAEEASGAGRSRVAVAAGLGGLLARRRRRR